MKFAIKEKKKLSDEKWKLLIVDDEQEVHNITKRVLKNFDYKNKGLEFFSAYNGGEAIELLKDNYDIDIVLLDVVMETDDAGLIVVKKIREELGNKNIRIILRTGQPGLYPPKDIIVNYDIDDYKEKTELTAIKLFITMISALRIGEYITTINKNANELEKKVALEVEKNRQKDKQLLEQKRLAQLGEMISMIAHQWRQPLSAISSTSASINLKAMLDTLDKQTAIELSKHISQYAKQLSLTIDNFRNFFQYSQTKEQTTLDKIVTTTLEIVKESITTNDIELIVELNSDKEIETYASEINQVLLNIIKNAQDILTEANIENPYIKIKTISINDKVYLSISDNGGGIPEDIINKIFDPYFSTKKERTGMGLGLYMSKIIIEEHCNGILTVENEANGAKFTIEL